MSAWAGGIANHRLRIAAVDEKDNNTWTRFRSADYVSGDDDVEPRLGIVYDNRPADPTAADLSSEAVPVPPARPARG